MKWYKCKRCKREIATISNLYFPKEKEITKEEYQQALKAATFHCPHCGPLSYNDVDEFDV